MATQTHGFVLMLRSRKFYQALTGTILAVTPLALGWNSMSPDERLKAIMAQEVVVAGLWASVVVMTGYEDSKKVPAVVGDPPDPLAAAANVPPRIAVIPPSPPRRST